MAGIIFLLFANGSGGSESEDRELPAISAGQQEIFDGSGKRIMVFVNG